MNSIFIHQIPIKLTKEPSYDELGREVLKCGFKIGGGIDQDFRQSPQGFTDNVYIEIVYNIYRKIEYNFFFKGIYVTDVNNDGPAWRSGLRIGDKILQCNGYDFTMVTHKVRQCIFNMIHN